MINFEEILEVLKANGLNSASGDEEVVRAVERIVLNPDDRAPMFSFLKSNGWMAGAAGANQPGQAIPLQAMPLPQGAAASATVDTATRAKGIGDLRQSRGLGIKKRAALVLLFIIIAVSGGLAFAFIRKIGPFALPMYAEENFLSAIAQKIDKINSASCLISGELGVADRDKDAEPFAIKEMSSTALLKRQYKSDLQRLRDAGEIINELNRGAGYLYYNYAGNDDLKPYPASIDNLFGGDTKNGYDRIYSIKDPETGQVYAYKAVEGGKNFALTINFETEEAIKAVGKNEDYRNKNNGGAVPTVIAGRTVTFSKDSNDDAYVYMSGEPPKSFFELLSDYSSMMPPELKIKTTMAATAEVKQEMTADWKFNVGVEGDFEDLSYEANVDALKKDGIYYFRLNNFPNLFFLGDLASMKGKWVSFNLDADNFDGDEGYSFLAEMEKNASKMEKEFKESRGKFIKFIEKEIKLADKNRLIAFKKKPVVEKINGRQLTRYELSFRKEAVLNFCLQLQEDIKNEPAFADYYKFMIDQGLIDYLKSDQFDEVFNYFAQNNTLALWTDANGYPVMFQETLRIVPPEAATQLEEKQIYITFRAEISDINTKVNIAAPEDSTSIQSVLKKMDESMGLSMSRKTARDAVRISDMRQLASAQGKYRSANNAYLILKEKGAPTAVSFLTTAPRDPVNSAGATCGSLGTGDGNYRYCALANAADWFCYYAKLENPEEIGGALYYFYTASESGSFYRKTEPTSRETCNRQD